MPKNTKPEVTKPQTAEPAPTTHAPQATTAKAEAKATKQQTAVMALVVALKEQRKIEVGPEALKNDGKFIVVRPSADWPEIYVGPSGGLNLPSVKSYPRADLATMINADQLLAKQVARESKKAAQNTATSTAPVAEKKEEPKADTPKATEQKKSKAS